MKLPNKTPKEKIIKLITDVMLRKAGNGHDGFSPWGSEIIVVEDEGRRSAYLSDDQKVLKPLTIQGIASEIISYCDQQNISNLLMDHDLAVRTAKTYLLRAIPMDTEQVKLSRKADEPGYCHFRQPYNLLENVTEEQFHESCPLFSDWINRVTLNRDAFIHFIGSIFENNSYNQQYLVLKGSGGDGKGSLLNCLHKFFGPIYAASFMSRILHKDWTSTTYQKRLVTFPDAQNLKHLNEEVFKAITGGNPVPYRGLYEKEFTGVSKAKFIVCTNEDVDVSGMLSDSRRRIYCEIKPAQKATPNYQEDLIEESQVFFSYCHTQYLKHCSQGLPIATDATVEDYLLEESYDDFDSFFCQYMAPNGSVKRGDVNQLFKHQVSRDGREFKRFKRYLQRVHGVTEIRIDGVRRLKGVCIRSAVRSLRN